MQSACPLANTAGFIVLAACSDRCHAFSIEFSELDPPRFGPMADTLVAAGTNDRLMGATQVGGKTRRFARKRAALCGDLVALIENKHAASGAKFSIRVRGRRSLQPRR